MPRNIVLCCDGTSNQFAKDRTSVIKLFGALVKNPDVQAAYYHPGIGTRAPTGAAGHVGSWLGKIAGLAFGYKLQDDIVDAYRFVMNEYQPGDRIFIFGFSRGAYTARVIAAMLHMYGLVPPGNDALVPYAVDMMWKISKLKDGSAKADYFKLADDFKSAMACRNCPVHFLGVWDTVNSVGWIGSPLALPFTRDNPSVATVRHAKAIDERRAFFRVNWFKPAPGQDVMEVWFPGSHCDVGGGFPEAESGMSKYPLQWMAKEAQKAGLLLDDARLDAVLGITDPRYARADPAARLHNSMTALWAIAEFVPKRHWNFPEGRWEWRMNLFRRRTMGAGPLVHPVAWEIGGGYADRLPAGARPLGS